MKNFIKNKLLIFLVHLCKLKKRNFDAKNPRILVVSTTALGDTLWATPALRAIKKKYKNAYLGALVSPTANLVLEKNPYVDRLFLLNKNSLFMLFKLFFILKKENFQAICLLHSSQRIALPLCAMLNPEYFIGTEKINKGLDSLFTHCLKQEKTHEIKRRLSILEKLSVESSGAQMEFFFEPSENFNNFSSPLIILHPGAKDAFRSYPKERYVELANRLKEQLKAEVVITGNKNEKELVDFIAKKTNSTSYTDLSLRDFATLIQKSDILITGDTGPLHLSLSLNKKSIALFVPTDPDRFGPYNAQNSLVIKKSPTCDKCLQRSCRDPVCFLQISTEEILEGCKKILK